MYDYCKDQIISTHYCRKSVKGSQTYFEGEHIHICGKVACNHCKSKWGNAEDCMNRCKEHANVWQYRLALQWSNDIYYWHFLKVLRLLLKKTSLCNCYQVLRPYVEFYLYILFGRLPHRTLGIVGILIWLSTISMKKKKIEKCPVEFIENFSSYLFIIT